MSIPSSKQLDQILEALKLMRTMQPVKQPDSFAMSSTRQSPFPSDGGAALATLSQELEPLWKGQAVYCTKFIETHMEAGLTREEAFWILQQDKLFKIMNNQ
jgi:hypothetical protein